MTTKRKVRTVEDVRKGQLEQAEKTTALAKAGVNALAVDTGNPWIEIAAELDKFIGAPLLKFTKQGEFAISDIDNIPDGTRCVAHADEIDLGWVKWVDGRPEDRRVGRVADKFVPPKRDDLGDNDPQQWELQDDGTRRDVWQFQMSVPITRLDNQETYRFTTGSKGGLACIGKLTRTYGRRVSDEKVPGLPIVELKADHYKHRTYGKIFTPSMIVVGWTGEDGKPLSLAEELNDELPI
jgi:hypothetical protein